MLLLLRKMYGFVFVQIIFHNQQTQGTRFPFVVSNNPIFTQYLFTIFWNCMLFQRRNISVVFYRQNVFASLVGFCVVFRLQRSTRFRLVFDQFVFFIFICSSCVLLFFYFLLKLFSLFDMFRCFAVYLLFFIRLKLNFAFLISFVLSSELITLNFYYSSTFRESFQFLSFVYFYNFKYTFLIIFRL